MLFYFSNSCMCNIFNCLFLTFRTSGSSHPGSFSSRSPSPYSSGSYSSRTPSPLCGSYDRSRSPHRSKKKHSSHKHYSSSERKRKRKEGDKSGSHSEKHKHKKKKRKHSHTTDTMSSPPSATALPTADHNGEIQEGDNGIVLENGLQEDNIEVHVQQKDIDIPVSTSPPIDSLSLPVVSTSPLPSSLSIASSLLPATESDVEKQDHTTTATATASSDGPDGALDQPILDTVPPVVSSSLPLVPSVFPPLPLSTNAIIDSTSSGGARVRKKKKHKRERHDSLLAAMSGKHHKHRDGEMKRHKSDKQHKSKKKVKKSSHEKSL